MNTKMRFLGILRLAHTPVRKAWLLLLCMAAAISGSVHVGAVNWSQGAFSMTQGVTSQSPYQRSCVNRIVDAQEWSEPASACVYDLGDGVEYFDHVGSRYLKKDTDVSFMPLYRRDSNMQLQRFNNAVMLVPNSKTVAIQTAFLSGKLEIFKNFTDNLQKVQLGNSLDIYEVPSVADFTLINSSGASEYVLGQAGFSGNGQFMVTKASGGAVIRINLSDFSQKTIGRVSTLGSVKLAVTGDGKYIANLGTPYVVFRVEGACGTTFADMLTEMDECPSRYYDHFLQPIFGNGIYSNMSIFSTSEIKFDTDASFTIYRPGNSEWHTLTFSYSRDGEPEELNLVSGKRLKYLALGDSYSSGEGGCWAQK